MHKKEFNDRYDEFSLELDKKIEGRISVKEAVLLGTANIRLDREAGLIYLLRRRVAGLAREVSSLTPDEKITFEVLLEEHDLLRHKK